MHFEQLSGPVIAITTCHPPCAPRREKRGRVRDPAAPFRWYMDSFAASGQKLLVAVQENLLVYQASSLTLPHVDTAFTTEGIVTGKE